MNMVRQTAMELFGTPVARMPKHKHDGTGKGICNGIIPLADYQNGRGNGTNGVHGKNGVTKTAEPAKPPILPHNAAIIRKAVQDLVDHIGEDLTQKIIEKFGHLFLPMLFRVKNDREYEMELRLIEQLARNFFIRPKIQGAKTVLSQRMGARLTERFFEEFEVALGGLLLRVGKEQYPVALELIERMARTYFNQPRAQGQQVSDMAAE